MALIILSPDELQAEAARLLRAYLNAAPGDVSDEELTMSAASLVDEARRTFSVEHE